MSIVLAVLHCAHAPDHSAMTQTELADYRVELDGYCGPLDLLLYLVRRQEVDILDLPMASITGQFIEFLEILQILDLDMIAEFVVVASSLVEIKSRLVLPQTSETPEVIEQIDDPRTELVQQLLEYKRFKEASQLLEEQAAQWQQRYPRLTDDRPKSTGDPSQDLFKEVELWDLVSALSRVLRKQTEATPAKVIYDDTPIAVYIEQIKERVDQEGRVAFSSFFAGAGSRSRIVGIFLAILELLRHQKYRAEQPVAYHEIWVLPPLENTAVEPIDPIDYLVDDRETENRSTGFRGAPALQELAGNEKSSDESIDDTDELLREIAEIEIPNAVLTDGDQTAALTTEPGPNEPPFIYPLPPTERVANESDGTDSGSDTALTSAS